MSELKAPTYIQPHWYTGDLKTRCTGCHKVVFATQAAAEAAVERIKVRQVMYVYQGNCGHWHLTRKLRHKSFSRRVA